MNDFGIKGGMTKEKIDGTYKRPAEATKENIDKRSPDYFVEYIKRFYDKYPMMFAQEPSLTQRCLDRLGEARVKLT